MTFELDPNANAAYVQISGRAVLSTRELDSQRIVDCGADGEIVGIEFLGVSRGVDLRGLPHREQMAKFFDEHHIHVN